MSGYISVVNLFQGYMRQALYACKTCCPNDTVQAGVCLACSFHCHEGHELVELYTKRSFRCDCGNSKFGEKMCSLDPVRIHLLFFSTGFSLTKKYLFAC